MHTKSMKTPAAVSKRTATILPWLMVGIPMAVVLGIAALREWSPETTIISAMIAGMAGGVLLTVAVIRGSRR